MEFKKIFRKPFIGANLVLLLLCIDFTESNETNEQRKFKMNRN